MHEKITVALIVAAALTSGCTIGDRELALPNPEAGHADHFQGWVAVLSGEMPDPIDQVSRHAWIVLHVPGEERLVRCEYLGGASCGTTDDPFTYFGHGNVALHSYMRTDQAKQIEACLEEKTPAWNDEHPGYFPIPGPNSNTYVDAMLRRCDIHADLPTTAIGKDYRGPIGVSLTSGGTGVQLESWVVGLRLGVTEGVEVHLFSLGLGVDFWPPAILVPANPGRIGFADR